VTLSRKLYRNT